MGSGFGQRLSEERFAELNARVVRRAELMYQLQAGNTARALQIFSEDTRADFKEVRAAVAMLERTLYAPSGETQEERASSLFAVKDLLIKGKKSDAIRLYAQQMDVDKQEAAREVEKIYLDMLADPNFLRPLLRTGHKIEAIRHYSEMSGLSLKEAREVIERLEAQMRDGE